ncbi:MAG TPA: exonuclease domain-containing protein [Trebonia sp.]
MQGFAALDLETTGLSPRTDRVVEIAVIQLDHDLSPCGEFTTLVKPGRDIDATHIHGISARDVVDAPRFEQIAPMLLDVLRGLRELAGALGIGANAVTVAHQMYLGALAIAAWADGVVTNVERTDLTEVARLLGFPASAVDIELAAARDLAPQNKVLVNGQYLHSGDAVCITGTTQTPREKLEARAAEAGLRVTSAVSRKTLLLVAADPDSESAKARRARELDVPIVAEQVFTAMLDRGIG